MRPSIWFLAKPMPVWIGIVRYGLVSFSDASGVMPIAMPPDSVTPLAAALGTPCGLPPQRSIAPDFAISLPTSKAVSLCIFFALDA